MRIEKLPDTETFQIHDAPALDPITVFLQSMGERQGRITVVCYGRAWSAYFGGMPRPIRDFLSSCDAEYLAGKMEYGKTTKKDSQYLVRIVEAVQAALKHQPDGVAGDEEQHF